MTTTALCLHSKADFRTSLLRTARLSEHELFVSCVESFRLAQVFFGQSKKYDVVVCELSGQEEDAEILEWMNVLSQNGTELVLLVPDGYPKHAFVNHQIESSSDQIGQLMSILTGEH